jgi:hypothetical protein
MHLSKRGKQARKNYCAGGKLRVQEFRGASKLAMQPPGERQRYDKKPAAINEGVLEGGYS